MRELILERLRSDATLADLLPGGIHDVEITRQQTPTAYDANGELLPCALVRLSSEVALPPYPTGSRMMVSVYFYQRVGYDAIDEARRQVYSLLHEHKLAAGVWTMRHTDDVLDQEDLALQCSLTLSRFEIIHRR